MRERSLDPGPTKYAYGVLKTVGDRKKEPRPGEAGASLSLPGSRGHLARIIHDGMSLGR